MNIYSALKLPQKLYSVDSEYNGHIEVIEVGSTRKIKVNGTTQSLSHNSALCNKLIWGKLANLVAEKAPNANSILLLGLGGGTIPHLLHKKIPNTYITSIEIDKEMVDIANRFFDLQSIPNHKVIIEDALRVLSHPENYDINKQSFNVVIVDIYVGSDFPELGKSGNFINSLKKMLVPGGLLVFNRIYINSHQEDVDSFIDQVSNFLVNVDTLVVPGYTNSDNIIVFGRSFEHTI